MQAILKVENISKSYKNFSIFDNLSFEVFSGEIFAIVGSSGCGKSSLINIMNSLDSDYRGKIILDGKELNSIRGNSLARFRNKIIGIVFQDHNLLEEFNALENVAMPAYIGGEGKKSADSRAIDIMKRLNVSNCREKFPSELSGGEAQRVAFCRAVINSPKIVFADEPTGNLDGKNAKILRELILELKKELNQTFVISTHSPEIACAADRILDIDSFKKTK